MKKRFFIFITAVICAFSLFTASCDVLSFIGGSKDAVDYRRILNEITLETMQANVKVVKTNATAICTGSGAIIKKTVRKSLFSDTVYKYYCLTNNHVIFDTSVYDLKVCDLNGEEFSAKVVFSDASYDLALLEFGSDVDFSIIEFAEADPRVNDVVFSVGQLGAQLNSITVGEVVSISVAPETDDSSSAITFDVIIHNAHIINGSSGGMLINADRKLVGINFAGLEDYETGESLNKYCAVPVSKVNQFLSANNFIV